MYIGGMKTSRHYLKCGCAQAWWNVAWHPTLLSDRFASALCCAQYLSKSSVELDIETPADGRTDTRKDSKGRTGFRDATKHRFQGVLATYDRMEERLLLRTQALNWMTSVLMFDHFATRPP